MAAYFNLRVKPGRLGTGYTVPGVAVGIVYHVSVTNTSVAVCPHIYSDSSTDIYPEADIYEMVYIGLATPKCLFHVDACDLYLVSPGKEPRR